MKKRKWKNICDRAVSDSLIKLQEDTKIKFYLKVDNGRERGRIIRFQNRGVFVSIKEKVEGFLLGEALSDFPENWVLQYSILKIIPEIPKPDYEDLMGLYKIKILSQKEFKDKDTGQKFYKVVINVLSAKSKKILYKKVKLILYGSYRLRKVN